MKSVILEIVASFLFVCTVMNAQEASSSAQCSVDLINVTQLEKPDGWPTKFVNKSKILGRRKFTPTESNGIEVESVSYEVRKIVVAVPQVQFDQCDHSAVMSNWYVIPERVVAFQSKGKTFVYALSGRLVSGPRLDSSAVGGTMDFMFYDEDGKGKFTRLKLASGVGFPPNIPAWAR